MSGPGARPRTGGTPMEAPTTTHILAVSGSPRSRGGSTYRIVEPFLEGAAAAGAETEFVDLAARDIHVCTGELHCFFRTPGRCIWTDDMGELMPKVGHADVLALCSPLYFGGPTAQLKAFVDRLTPMLDPTAGLGGGEGDSSLRPGYRVGKVVLIASCGDWDVSAFDLLVRWARFVAGALGSQFAGALLRPHAPALLAREAKGDSHGGVYAAAKEAGRQVVRDGRFRAATLKAVAQELVSFEEYARELGQAFRRAAEEGGEVEA
ncbi:MAG: flavodoxin family protein [Candidatus Brocadiia bacterium]